MTEISGYCGGGDPGRSLVPGSLRGYRTWRLLRHAVPDGMLPLTSVVRRDVVWPPTLTARCTPPDVGAAWPVATGEVEHAAPQPGCHCGIYAWYDPDDTSLLQARIFGAVDASGLVLLGERGFRAERARITAVVTRNRRLARTCRQAGIATYSRRRDLLRDLPPEDVSALLGRRPAPAPPPAAPRSPRADAVDRSAVLAVWARTAVIIGAVVGLPAAAAIVTVVSAEVALMLVLAHRLR